MKMEISEGKEVQTVVIEVTEPRGVRLPPQPNSDNAKEREGIMLIPGENTVRRELWEKVKENPGVKIALQAVILKKTRDGSATNANLDWNNVKPKQLRDILNALDSLEKIKNIKDKISKKKKNLISICDKRIQTILDTAE